MSANLHGDGQSMMDLRRLDDSARGLQTDMDASRPYCAEEPSGVLGARYRTKAGCRRIRAPAGPEQAIEYAIEMTREVGQDPANPSLDIQWIAR